MESEFFGYARARSPAPTTTATASSRPPTAARCSSTRSATCRCRCSRSCCARSRSSSVRPVGAARGAAGRRAHPERDAQGPRRRGRRPAQFRQDLYLPPQRDPDPRAAAARAARGPRGDRERVLERLARDAGVCAGAALDAATRCRRLARYPLPGQRARAREHAASRRRALAARARSTTWTCRVGVHRQRRAGARPADRSAPPGASRCRRGAAADDLASSTRSSATSSSALEHHRFNRTAAGISLGLSLRQMRYPDGAAQRQRRRRLGEHRSRVNGEARLRGGWLAARRCSANFGPRPGRATPVEPRRRPLDQPAAGRVRRRRDRAAVHQPARSGARIRTSSRSARPARLGALPVRRDGELVQFVSCDERAWHAGASRWRGRAAATTSRSASSSRALEGEPFEDAQYAAPRARCSALRGALSDRRDGRPRAHRAGTQDRSRRGLRLGRLLRIRFESPAVPA